MTKVPTRTVVNYCLDGDVTLEAFLADIHGQVADAKRQHPDAFDFYISEEGSYDEGYYLCLTYHVPLTPEEIKSLERQREEEEKRALAYHRRQYEELKKKFGD